MYWNQIVSMLSPLQSVLYQNYFNKNLLYPKCLIPKMIVPKMPCTKKKCTQKTLYRKWVYPKCILPKMTVPETLVPNPLYPNKWMVPKVLMYPTNRTEFTHSPFEKILYSSIAFFHSYVTVQSMDYNITIFAGRRRDKQRIIIHFDKMSFCNFHWNDRIWFSRVSRHFIDFSKAPHAALWLPDEIAEFKFSRFLASSSWAFNLEGSKSLFLIDSAYSIVQKPVIILRSILWTNLRSARNRRSKFERKDPPNFLPEYQTYFANSEKTIDWNWGTSLISDGLRNSYEKKNHFSRFIINSNPKFSSQVYFCLFCA